MPLPTNIINFMATSGAMITIIVVLQAINAFDILKKCISKVYTSPIFIILLLSVFGFISYTLNWFGLIETFLDQIYIFIFSITLVTYLVAFVGYSLYEGSLETADPQPPLGWIGSFGFGSAGGLVGEFIQVMGFFQTSKLIIAGIVFGQWNIKLSLTNALLLDVIGVGLAALASASIGMRWLKLSGDWDEIIKNIKQISERHREATSET